MNWLNRLAITDLLGRKIILQFPDDNRIEDVVRKLPGCKWNKKKKEWNLPYSEFHCQKVIELLSPWQFDFDPRIYREAAPKKKVTVTYFPNREGLFEFQAEAVDFIHQHKGKALLGDEMGLGKTIEALGWVRERPDLQKILIVCPASVVYKWEKEILKWVGESEQVGIVLTGKEKLPPTRWMIMSYAIMVAQQQSLRDIDLDLMILDEAHKVKEKDSQRARCAKSLNYANVLLLTGTPVLNRPKELFNLLQFINPVEWDNFFQYAMRYCDAKKNRFGWDFDGASNLEELRGRLKPYMVRRTKKEVMLQLPDLTRTRIPVQVDRTEIRLALQSLQNWIEENGYKNGGRAEAMVRLGKLRQAMGIAKVPVVVEMAEDILESDPSTKLVIYAVHKVVVQKLVEGLSAKRYSVSTIVGDVSQEDRQKRIDAFQNHANPRVMVISSAGGEGIDLFKSSVIIFSEREWTPAAEEQAEARCHRFGQKNAVEAIYLIATDTVDTDIDHLIEGKRHIFKELIGQDAVETTRNTIDEFFSLIQKKR